MGRKGCTGVILALSLLANVFCLPPPLLRVKRQLDSDNEIVKRDSVSPSTVNLDLPPPVPYNNDDDDDDFNIPDKYPSSNGGSNIVSLLKLATGLLSGSSGSSKLLLRLIKEIVNRNKPSIILERHDLSGNEINIDYKPDSKPPPFEKQRNGNENDSSSSDSNESENVAAEESLEDDSNDSGRNSDSNVDDSDDDSNSDYDEPPGGGDGQGGGILGLLAGLSGGEDGQSDLGSLLATIGGIVANLSGDGIDLNALIASGIGLFVGLLSEGEENPGEIIASYLLTSLDTITGGGAKNNGAFFGKFLSKLVKGTSASQSTNPSDKESGEPAQSPLWTLKLDILRALLQFGTSILGVASSAVFSSSSS